MVANSIHFETFAQKRAQVQQQLLLTPNDVNLRKLLMQLCPVAFIQQVSSDGVFISYSRSDELFAFDLAADLRDGGADIWLDMMDVSYDDDGDWGTEITQALNRCGIMLMIVSKEALNDPDLQKERLYFINQGKIVLPIVYQEEQQYDLRAYLPAIDLSQNYNIGLQTLIRLMAVRR